MATRALTMSNSLPSDNRRRGFTSRLILLLLFVAGMTFWTYFVYLNQHAMSKMLMTGFAAVMIALAASLGARFLFYKRNWFVRLVAAWSSLALGLFLLGMITNWKLGIGPIEFWRKNYDWIEIAQLGGGMIVALAGLGAWWRGPAAVPSPRKLKRSAKRRPAPEHEDTPRRQKPVQPLRADPPRPMQASVSSRQNSRTAVRLKVAKQARAITRSAPRPEKMLVGRLTKSGRSNRLQKLFNRNRPRELQISVYEEHRCPYCLEDVKRNDPRGVKECSVCHTLHHADCWDITGMCQVPHLNS